MRIKKQGKTLFLDHALLRMIMTVVHVSMLAFLEGYEKNEINCFFVALYRFDCLIPIFFTPNEKFFPV